MWLRHLLLLLAVLHCVWATTGTTTEKYDILTAQYPKETEELIPGVPEDEVNNNQQVETLIQQKTITELVNEQTEAIKKIISEQQEPKPAHNDYAIVSQPEQIKEQLEKDSIEELKQKCQHLSRIFNPSHSEETTESAKDTVNAFGPNLQPDFLKFKPKFPSPPLPLPLSNSRPPQMSGNYFIFTQNPDIYGKRTNKYSIDKDKLESAGSAIDEVFVSPEDELEEPEEDEPTDVEVESEENTITASTPAAPIVEVLTMPENVITTTVKPKQPPTRFKYVRLEPLILKQSFLPNGKTVFQWYRLLPITQSFVQIPDTPANKNVSIVAQPQTYNHNVLLPEQYQYYMDPLSGAIKPTKAIVAPLPITTTTTEKPYQESQPQPQPLHTRPQFFINPQTGMIYQSALPHQFIYHKRIATMPTTTTTTTTTEKIPVPEYTVEITQQPEEKPPSKPVDNNYRHEFRFVIPMVVTGTQEDRIAQYPNKLDPYAYLPKNQRPGMMNIPVPYSPTYQMIRTLAVPNKLKGDAKTTNMGIYNV